MVFKTRREGKKFVLSRFADPHKLIRILAGIFINADQYPDLEYFFSYQHCLYQS
jgi:hypothetical protein